MGCSTGSPNINKTFIIEPPSSTGNTGTILSACTGVFTDIILSCAGDSTIEMGQGLVTFNSNVDGIGSMTANTIEATTYLSGGTNILDIVDARDNYVTGGTFSHNSGSLSLTRRDGANVIVTNIEDFFVTGGTFINDRIYFDRNDQLSAFTVDLSTLDLNDTFVTGATLSGNILTLGRNDNAAIPVDLTDIVFSGGSGTCIIDLYVRNIHGCSPITVHDELNISGATTFGSTIKMGPVPTNDNSLSQILARNSTTGIVESRDVASIISAATSQDTFITGFTYNNANSLEIVRNDGTTFNTLIESVTGWTVTGNLNISGITTVGGDILPTTDNTINIGSPSKRMRSVNTVSGTSTFWKTSILSASTVNLGLDSQGNQRIITPDSSVLRNDCLGGDTY